MAHMACLQTCGVLYRHCPHIQAAFSLQLGGQTHAVRIIDIDNRCFQALPCKQLGLGLPVSLHAAVIVQVILGEIGKDGCVKLRAIKAVLFHANRRSFNRTRSNALLHIVCKSVLQAHWVRRGHARTHHLRWYANAQGAYHGTALARSLLVVRQSMRQPPCRRCFAVGSRNGQHLQLRRGMLAPEGCDLRSGSFQT